MDPDVGTDPRQTPIPGAEWAILLGQARITIGDTRAMCRLIALDAHSSRELSETARRLEQTAIVLGEKIAALVPVPVLGAGLLCIPVGVPLRRRTIAAVRVAWLVLRGR